MQFGSDSNSTGFVNLHKKYCDVSPNRLYDGQVRKSSNNCYAQYIELGRSFTPDWHRSPDRTIND